MKKTPKTYARELHESLRGANSSRAREIIRAFLAELRRSRKFGLLQRIAEAFVWIALSEEGYRAGTITTARALDASVRARVKKKFGNVVFEEKVDPSLLGGAVIEVEDCRIDGSVRAKLEALKRMIAGTA